MVLVEVAFNGPWIFLATGDWSSGLVSATGTWPDACPPALCCLPQPQPGRRTPDARDIAWNYTALPALALAFDLTNPTLAPCADCNIYIYTYS